LLSNVENKVMFIFVRNNALTKRLKMGHLRFYLNTFKVHLFKINHEDVVGLNLIKMFAEKMANFQLR